MLCGLAGSGKTTIALAIAARLQRCVHIETDAIRAMVAKPEYASSESRFVYQAAISMAEQALKNRFDVLLVATFPTEDSRREAISSLADFCDAWLFVWAWCDPQLAYRRSSEANPRISRENFMRVARTFNPPKDALVIDSRATAPEEAATKILAALEVKS